MAYDNILVGGTTSKLIEVLIRATADGQPLTGLAVGAVAIKYIRDGGAAGAPGTVDLGNPAVLATQGTWETDAWKETAIAGLYQYGVPDLAIAAGATGVTIIFTCTNALVAKYRIVLTAANLQDGVRAGLTALPNAAADAAGGLPISDAGGLDLDAILADTGELQTNLGNVTKINGTSIAGTGTQVADAFVQFFNQAAPTGSINSLPTALPGQANGLFIAGTNAAVTVPTLTTHLVGTVDTVGVVNSTTGYELSATGLDNIMAASPNGLATTFPERMNQLWARWFNKATMTATTLVVYRDDGTTPMTTATVSDDLTTQTQGEAATA